MAEFENRDLRVNESTAELARIQEQMRAKLLTLPSGPLYKTLPDGRVIDRRGVVLYDPKAQSEQPKVGL